MSISTETKLTIDERNKYIVYIYDYIDEMPFNIKREILTMSLNSIDDKSKIKHKGDGSILQFDYLPNNSIIWIYNKIHSVICNDTAATASSP